MTGWRAGLVVGNAEVVEHYRQLKTNLDSGMFEAVQHATAVALTEARDFPREMSAVYERRRDLLAGALAAIGLEVEPPRATPYFWVSVPEGHDSASFTELVLEQAGVVVSPGPSFGPSGEGFVRLSLTVPDDRLEEAAGRIESSLRSGIIRRDDTSARSAPGAEPERGFAVAAPPKGVDPPRASFASSPRTAGVDTVGELVQHRRGRTRARTSARASSRS